MKKPIPSLLAAILLLGGCATSRAVTELQVDAASRVGLAVPPPEADPSRWLAPPGQGPFEARARLVSPDTGVSEAPEVEVRRTHDGALTLLCRPCDRGWIDLVDAEGWMRFPGPVSQLEKQGELVHLPLRVVTRNQVRGDPEGDLALRQQTYADLVALFPLEAVTLVRERTLRTRPRSWTTTGVLSGSGLLVGGAGILMMANQQDGRRWPGGLLLGTGVAMVAGAVVEALLPRSSESVVDRSL